MPFQNEMVRMVSSAYYDVVLNKPFISYGSCTLVSLLIDELNLRMISYVLGDSGFLIIRSGKIVYRSTEMQHSFNFPFQIGLPFEHADKPENGIVKYLQLQVNDVIIIGSDGLFDNLFDEAILYYVNMETKFLSMSIHKGYTEAARKIAKFLTFQAKRNGESKKVVTPFNEELNRLKLLKFKLEIGKNDDTTVIAVIIS
jgi:protein phosphatase PTC7